MSMLSEVKRVSVPDIRGRKNAKPIVCLTCYHAHTARLLDERKPSTRPMVASISSRLTVGM